ncbi:CLUMA_CG011771, isoform A [Clunio marinus]|uniref:CLUMA_CG011771, isoform A n=1 Tax=Clunio marinus TaxID=568069 RepID=A0A1J1IDS6_9DIPT|nr:CLUMA_CG011771, isoform A [Clunio marinus]
MLKFHCDENLTYEQTPLQIKWILFECWQRFPAIMKIERETEVRRQKWRMKVWDLLPDYKPQDTP